MEAAQRGSDWTKLANTLEIPYKTAYSWIMECKAMVKKRGGHKPRILTSEEIRQILLWIEEQPMLTLKRIKERIFQEFHKILAPTTISNALQGRVYCGKVQPTLEDFNSIDAKIKRREYLQAFGDYMALGKDILFLGETNFNIYCRRRQKRFPSTMAAPSIHLKAAISEKGIFQINYRRGSYNALSSKEWLENLLLKWRAEERECSNLVLVCANFPHDDQEVEEIFKSYGVTLLFLPPYSWHLNPMEIIFEQIERFVKHHINERERVISLSESGQCLQYLESIIEQAKESITPEDCQRAIQFTEGFHEQIMAMGDIVDQNL